MTQARKDIGTFRRVAGLIVLLLVAGPAPALAQAPGPAMQPGQLPESVAKVFRTRNLPEQAFSAYVLDLGTGNALVTFNADVPRNPASVIKLLTTFVALDTLGPTYRWHTGVFADGPVDKGTLRGDLILKGGGDPYLVTERLWLLQREVRLKGIRHIDGDLVIDNSYFAREEHDPGAFDGQPYRAYNTLPDALLVNFQSVNFLFRPDPVRGRVEIVAEPPLANLDIRNNMRLFRGGCASRQSGISMVVGDEAVGPRITFSGALANNCPEYQLNRALPDATSYAYGLFRGLWEEQGGTLSGRLREGQIPDGKQPLVRFESLPLAEVIRGVNKFSNNVMTRQIFLTLGAEAAGAPATVEKSRQATVDALARRKLVFPELEVGNGAGLARDTRISARSMARVLAEAAGSTVHAEFQASLSIAGLDGTTRRRFQKDPMAGQLHLKTGSLNGVSSIAGYVRSRSGRDYAVVAMMNEAKATWGGGQEAQDALLRWVYER